MKEPTCSDVWGPPEPGALAPGVTLGKALSLHLSLEWTQVVSEVSLLPCPLALPTFAPGHQHCAWRTAGA